MDKFVVETYNLGDLNAIRVRIDNAGPYPSWFLDRIEISDSHKKWIFNSRQWFSLKRGDGKIDRIIRENVILYAKTKAKIIYFKQYFHIYFRHIRQENHTGP